MRARIVGLLLVLVGVVAAAAPARAQGYGPGTYQPPPPPPPGVIRSGFIAGVAIGGGAFALQDCSDCDGTGGLALKGHLGGMLGPRLALMFDLESASGPFGDDAIITQTTAMAVIRWWAASIFYLQAGLGAAWLHVSAKDGGLAVTSEAGGSLMLGAGVELVQRTQFTLDVQLRLIATRYGDRGDDNSFGIGGATLLLGFNWY